MKKVLYLTNIEVPYRVRFFNELAKYCDLTVLYEQRSSGSRNEEWAKSATTQHKRKYLKKNSVFLSGMIEEIRKDYDTIIVGCYNDPVQMLAILAMRLLRIPYVINLDGETFLEGNSLKTKLKKFFLFGAEQYLVAGEKSAKSLECVAKGKPVIPYYFSSLSDEELIEHRLAAQGDKRDDTILVVGQYFDYKGMDVALQAARMDPNLQYKFVGMGSRTEKFLKDHAGEIPENVQIIPFLQKEDLEKEYLNCGMLVLPSRRECWGLVINEAASFGMPIVSTWGSGAAVEFLSDDYPQYLAKPDDAESLLGCIRRQKCNAGKEQYSAFLVDRSKKYSIERSVDAHVKAI